MPSTDGLTVGIVGNRGPPCPGISTRNNQMAVVSPTSLTDVSRRVLRLQVFTILWMTLAAALSLGTAWSSHSPARLGFGGDSLVELLSAAVAFWRFRLALKHARAARLACASLFTPACVAV